MFGLVIIQSSQLRSGLFDLINLIKDWERTAFAYCLVTAWQSEGVPRELATDGATQLEWDLILGERARQRLIPALCRNTVQESHT